MFRKFLITVALALAATMSMASSTYIDTSGLSAAQIAGIKAQAAKVAADNATGTTAHVGAMATMAATWGQQAAAAAEGFAKAITIAAKELGVTVNEFLGTDAGKLTAALIIWKVAGAAIAKIIYVAIFVIIGQIVARLIYKRIFTQGYKEVTYERFFGAFKGTRFVRIPKGFSEMRTDGEWLAFWVMIGASLGSLAIGGIILA